MTKNPLTDLIPAQYRQFVYALMSLAVLAYGAWQASEGNVEVFIGSLLVSLTGGMASSNVSTEDPSPFYDGHAPRPGQGD